MRVWYWLTWFLQIGLLVLVLRHLALEHHRIVGAAGERDQAR